MIVSMFLAAFNNAWAPWAYEQMDAHNYSGLKKAAKPYTLFFGFVVYWIMLLAPEILLVMGGKEYMEARSVMPPIMTGFREALLLRRDGST